MTEDEILVVIQQVRAVNNICWMNLLKLALKAAPEEAREILGRINDNDKKISQLLGELANENREPGDKL